MAEKESYAPKYIKFGIHQRKFFPPMKNATCYVCHKPGHIAAYCYARKSNSDLQKMQTVKRLSQTNKWRKQSYIRYENNFYGYCFYCKEFGHKIIECRKYRQRLMFNTSRRFMSQSNFVHAHNSAKTIIKCSKGGLQWIKKVTNCDLALTAQDLKSQWYLDSGCSKHMTGDRSKFITLDEKKSGNVTFGNDKSGKIKGKGSVSIDNGRGKAQDVLFVDGLKANLLSVS